MYNLVKSISEAKQWLVLTDQQKRYEIFGDLYLFFQLIGQHTKNNSHVLIYSQDTRTFYLSVYYLYPRNIVVSSDKKQFAALAKSHTFDYIALYDAKMPLINYKKIAVLSPQLKNVGELYKKR